LPNFQLSAAAEDGKVAGISSPGRDPRGKLNLNGYVREVGTCKVGRLGLRRTCLLRNIVLVSTGDTVTDVEDEKNTCLRFCGLTGCDDPSSVLSALEEPYKKAPSIFTFYHQPTPKGKKLQRTVTVKRPECEQLG